MHRLARLPLRSRESRRLLGAMRAVFINVSDIDYRPSELPDLPDNPLNAHYQPALDLARLILRSTTFELAEGEVRAASFLIDMNRVFEDFVVVALREALRLTDYAFPQGGQRHALPLDTDGLVHLKPDISWWESRRCMFVGDVKYKRTGVQGAPNADIYQVLAYAVGAGLPSALLIYAAGEREEYVYDISAAGKQVEVAVLDLGGEPDELLARVKTLAAKVREHRARGHPESRAA